MPLRNINSQENYSFLSDIDDCANVTCRNDGTCVDGVNNYTCSCPVGYSGDFCETGSLNRRRLCYFSFQRADCKCVNYN